MRVNFCLSFHSFMQCNYYKLTKLLINSYINSKRHAILYLLFHSFMKKKFAGEENVFSVLERLAYLLIIYVHSKIHVILCLPFHITINI